MSSANSPGDAMIQAIADAVAEKVLAQLRNQLSAQPAKILYSLQEAAERMSLSRSTLKNIVRDREIAVVRRGTRVLIHHKEIENWVIANRA